MHWSVDKSTVLMGPTPVWSLRAMTVTLQNINTGEPCVARPKAAHLPVPSQSSEGREYLPVFRAFVSAQDRLLTRICWMLSDGMILGWFWVDSLIVLLQCLVLPGDHHSRPLAGFTATRWWGLPWTHRDLTIALFWPQSTVWIQIPAPHQLPFMEATLTHRKAREGKTVTKCMLCIICHRRNSGPLFMIIWLTCNLFNASISRNLSSYKGFLHFRWAINLNVLYPELSESAKYQLYPEGISVLGDQLTLVQARPSEWVLSLSLQESPGCTPGQQHYWPQLTEFFFSGNRRQAVGSWKPSQYPSEPVNLLMR